MTDKHGWYDQANMVYKHFFVTNMPHQMCTNYWIRCTKLIRLYEFCNLYCWCDNFEIISVPATCNGSKSFEYQPVPFSLSLVGNFIPISQVREDVACAYIKEAEWRASNMLVPFQKMCAQRKVRISLHNCLIVPPAVNILFSGIIYTLFLINR